MDKIWSEYALTTNKIKRFYLWRVGKNGQRIGGEALSMVSKPLVKKTSKKQLPEIVARPFDRAKDRPSRIENLLSRQEQAELRSIGTVMEYRRSGITIFSAGEDAHFVYAIEMGVVRISRSTDSGGRQILAIMLPGDLFGIPERELYANSAETVSPTTLHRFPWQRLREVMLRDPQLQLNLFVGVARDLRQAQRQIMILGRQSISQRLASFILDFIPHAQFYDERRSLLTIPLNRFDLADYLGTSPESIARAFARLEHDGLVRRISARTIKLLNMDALKCLHREPRRHNL